MEDKRPFAEADQSAVGSHGSVSVPTRKPDRYVDKHPGAAGEKTAAILAVLPLSFLPAEE